MDIFEQLLEDHGKQRGLAGGIADSQGQFDERKRLWQAYRDELVAHASAEEQLLYSALMAQSEGQSKAQHSVAEHKVMEDIIEELDAMDLDSSGWLNRFATLRDKVEHHLDEEEREVFPLAREVIPEAELRTLGEQYADRKRSEAA